MFVKVWSQLLGKCLFSKKEPSNGVDKNAVAVTRLSSCGEEEAVVHVPQNNESCFIVFSLPHYYVELEVTGKCVNSGGGYGLEILAWFRFYEPEKSTQWLETRLTKIEKQLRESATYKIYFFCAIMIL